MLEHDAHQLLHAMQNPPQKPSTNEMRKVVENATQGVSPSPTPRASSP